MTKFQVRFTYTDDMCDTGIFEYHDLETLVKNFNAKRFILLPNNRTLINLDHVARIRVDEVPDENKYR